MIWTGEKEGWDILHSLDPKDVTSKTGAAFVPDGTTYTLICLSQEINISLRDRNITSSSSSGAILINDLGEYSRLSILRYMSYARDMQLSGKLVKPADLPGGDFFSKGTHVLPLEKIIRKFENDLSGFLNTGESLGGIRLEYGDASLKLMPFPRVPVTIILWAGDDEFPAQGSLLFDSSCTSHMAIDILWSTAIMTIEMMVRS
jgi:hypothetical protein